MGYRGPHRWNRERIGETRHWVHELFEVGAGGRLGFYVDYVIMLLIAANVVAVMLETVDPLFETYGREFFAFEVLSVTVFTIEYLGRLWSAVEHPDYEGAVRGRLQYARSPYMVIDVLAILPFFIGAIVDLRFLRALRLIRFMRLLKLARYSESMKLFVTAFWMKREELTITTFIGIILLLVASSTMYFVERTAQPEEFSSIPETLWWGVITLTTVGYGDVSPVTPLGQVLGAIVAVIGIGLFALPASILASGFIEAARGETATCPHCGELIHSEDIEPD